MNINFLFYFSYRCIFLPSVPFCVLHRTTVSPPPRALVAPVITFVFIPTKFFLSPGPVSWPCVYFYSFFLYYAIVLDV